MQARVDACIRIRRSEAPVKLIERLRRALSFPNPAYQDRLRLGLSARGVPRTLCFLEENNEEVRLPRGAVHLLRKQAALDGMEIEFEDRRVLPGERLPKLPLPEMRGYQARAVDMLCAATQGTTIIPCGGGKTRVGIGAMATLRTPSLVLVHTLDLAGQWQDEMRELLGIDAGIIGGGENVSRPVTVALIQAFSRWSDRRLDDFLNRFGLLVLDEAHHVAASTFHAVVGRCPAHYRLGLTATPEREDGLTPLLDLFLGPPLVVVGHAELAAAGVLELPEIRIVETAFDYPYTDVQDYTPMLNALVSDEARNRLICETVAQETVVGNTCMVLSGRIDHCEAICSQLVAAGVKAALLTSRVRKERRKKLLDRARAGQLKALVATTLADEGLDLPRLSRVVLAYPGRARGRTMQRLGRLMRSHPGKESAVLIDIVDRKVPVLRRQHLERRRLYAEILGVQASQLRPQAAFPTCTTACAE